MKISTISVFAAISVFLLAACTDDGKTPEYYWPTGDDQENVTPDPENPDPENPGTDDPDPENPGVVDPENPGTENPDPEEPGEGGSTPIIPTPGLPDPIDPVSKGWTDVSANYGTLPIYIKVYKSPKILQNKSAIAYIAVADMSKADWDVWSIKDLTFSGTSSSYKTPKQVYDSGKWPVVINGGYFYSSGSKRYPASLAVSGGETLSHNINYASEDWKTIYYPTRAALMEKKDGTFDVCWTYYSNTDAKEYTYHKPAPNKIGNTPKQTPDSSYPEKAGILSAQTAIGGGPVLVHQKALANTYQEELYSIGGINPTTSQPRTAIGFTAAKELVFFVCEGRNMTSGVAGLTTEQVGKTLLDLGCIGAINLDGGGSSCMLVNGKTTIKCSDGSQRSVASTVMLK